MVAFHKTLSDRSVYLRYLNFLKLSERVAHERLSRIYFTDYDRDMALVVERRDDAREIREVVAVGRLSKSRFRKEAEFAIIVGDPFQKRGLGRELLRRLIEIGRAEGLERIFGHISPDNAAMQSVCRHLGFTMEGGIESPTLRAVLDLE
jgi:acetyltransferase